MKSYREIWGDRWRDGPPILADIVVWLKHRAVQVDMDSPPSRWKIDVPLPKVDGRHLARYGVAPQTEPIRIDQLFPVEMQPILVDCLHQAATDVVARCGHILTALSNKQDTAALRTSVNQQFLAIEREWFAARKPTLQMRVAESFGFHGGQLPVPAGIALSPSLLEI